jgi:glutaconate CoA-transferase subunit A
VPAPPPVDVRRPLADLVAQVPPGSLLGVGGAGLSRKPLAALDALAAQGRGDLTLVTVVGGLDVEWLLAAGMVRQVIAAYVGLEGLGLAPTFRRMREEGTLAFEEWSEWTLLLALRAAAEGVPYAPTRAALGTDTAKEHPRWREVACPFTGEPLLAVPALAPEVSLIHAAVADPLGQAWVEGDAHADRLLAQASARVLVTAEEVLPEDGRPRLGEPTVWGAAAVAAVPRGAWPGGCAPRYRPDPEAIAARLAAGVAR